MRVVYRATCKFGVGKLPRFCSTNQVPLTHWRKVKSDLQAAGWFKKLAFVTVAASFGFSLYYYSVEWKDTPEKSIVLAINKLKHPHDEVKEEGFKTLEESFYVTKRVFSGLTTIPASKNFFLRRDLIESLLSCVQDNNLNVRQRSLSWLYWLTKDHPEASEIILGLENHFFENLTAAANPSQTHWFIASNVILNVLKFSENKTDLVLHPQLKASGSSDPFALLMHEAIVRQVRGGPPDAIRDHILRMYVESQLPHQPSLPANVQGASLISIASIGLFAWAWGGILWKLRSIRFSAKNPDIVPLISKWVKKRRVGRNVFALMLIDYALTYGMQFTSTSHLDFDFSRLGFPFNTDKNSLNTATTSYYKGPLEQTFGKIDVPMSSVYPVLQMTFFTAQAAYLVHKKIFVVTPLLLAFFYNHRDFFLKFDEINYLKQKMTFPVPEHLKNAYDKANVVLGRKNGFDDEQ